MTLKFASRARSLKNQQMLLIVLVLGRLSSKPYLTGKNHHERCEAQDDRQSACSLGALLVCLSHLVTSAMSTNGHQGNPCQRHERRKFMECEAATWPRLGAWRSLIFLELVSLARRLGSQIDQLKKKNPDITLRKLSVYLPTDIYTD